VVRVEIEQILRKAPGFDADDIDADAFSASTIRVR